MTVAEKNRKQRLRRALAKEGYSLHKSRCRTPHLDDLGDYMIVLTKYNAVVAGLRFEYTLDDVEEWWKSLEREAMSLT